MKKESIMRAGKTFTGMILAASLGVAGSASASVVYNWVPIAYSKEIYSTKGFLKVTDAAYRRGRLHVDYNTVAFPNSAPDSPLLNLTFAVNNPATSSSVLHSMPRNPQDMSVIDASLQFTDTGNITGDITATDTSQQIDFGGSAHLWNIAEFGSDDTELGCFETPCFAGATGFWRVNPSTVPGAAVPEPPAGLLFATALGILGFFYRKRQKSGK